jgi:IS5 family transposase
MAVRDAAPTSFMRIRDTTSRDAGGILRRRSIIPRIARRGIEKNDRLGKHRWVVERTHAWLAGFGKLRIHFERSLDTHLALLTLACALICGRFVYRFC